MAFDSERLVQGSVSTVRIDALASVVGATDRRPPKKFPVHIPPRIDLAIFNHQSLLAKEAWLPTHEHLGSSPGRKSMRRPMTARRSDTESSKTCRSWSLPSTNSYAGHSANTVLPQLTFPSQDLKSADIKNFADLPLTRETAKGLQSSHFQVLTEIQQRAIPIALKGKDILGAAKTGSGKTLTFLVPVLEKLYRARWTEFDGLGALIISPTRELAVQTFEVLRKIGRYHNFSADW